MGGDNKGESEKLVPEWRIIKEAADDRSDSVRWGHPEMRDAWATGGLIELVEQIRDGVMSREERKAVRDRMTEMALQMFEALPKNPDVEEHGEWSEYQAPGCAEEPDAPSTRVLVRSPRERKPLMPAIFLIHGGGLFMGAPEMEQSAIKECSRAHDAVVVAPTYRFAPDERYPAAVNDLHAAYEWMLENADELGIDSDRVVLNGTSSGGHLALALAFRLKRYGRRPRGVVAELPPIDDRQCMPASRVYDSAGERGNSVWDSHNQHMSWLAWLGPENIASGMVGPEAVPGHATVEDCRGLPPIYLHGVESDPDADDVLRFALLCRAAGVFTEVHSWGGTTHMSLAMSVCPLSGRYHEMVSANIHDALTFDLRRS